MNYTVDATALPDGFTIRVNKKNFLIRYPSSVWNAFPTSLHIPFAQTMAFVATMHLSFPRRNTIAYAFPSPVNEAFFSYGLLFAMTENLLEYDAKKTKTTDYLRVVLNSYYRRSFTDHAPAVSPASIGYTPKKDTALVPFSFGKDSLLTLGLSRELGIRTVPIFFLEPSNTLENQNKRELIRRFKENEGISVETFPVSAADLRDTNSFGWGWDNFLTHYTLLLIPYMYAHRASYFFWSNEYNRDVTAPDTQGFIAHHTFEQSPRWLQMLEVAVRSFGANVQMASILETLPELLVLRKLHVRYPALASYQLSCLNDAPSSATKRWCGNCYECGKTYAYLKALGIDPKNVALRDDMFAEKHKKHFYIFSPEDFHNAFTFNREEYHYVFWEAAKRGAKGALVDEFLRRYGSTAKKNEAIWRKRYLSVYPFVNTPGELRARLKNIFSSTGDPV